MNGLGRFIAGATVLWGWRRLVIAAIVGAVSALSLAPFHLLPVLFVTFPILVWLLDGVTEPQAGERRLGAHIQAFGIGWAFGFGYFLAGLYWIGYAFLVEAEDFAWMLPFVAAALPGGLAIFTGLTTMIARLLGGEGYSRVLALAVSWTAFEAARGNVLSGFPWNRIGQAFAGSEAWIQGAAYVGDLGLTFILVAVAAAPATLADRKGLGRGWAAPLSALVVLAGLWVAGTYRLSQAADNAGEGVRVRIVQPAIDQASKWLPGNRSRIVSDYLELSDAATSPDTMGVDGVTYLVWPETALPMLLEREPDVSAAIAALLPEGTTLLMGSVRTDSAPDGRRLIYNSVLAIDAEGEVVATYDKERLVPFGEYLPFQELLESVGISQLTRLPGGFSAGSGNRLMSIAAGESFSPLICYEIIFSNRVVDAPDNSRPGWILNVTNDAWFGISTGPYQHLAQSKLRAVEEGLPVVRAANTGVSAVIDAYGREQSRLELGRRGVLDASLPRPLARTVFSQYGHGPVSMLLLVVVLGFLVRYIVIIKKSNM